MNKEAILNDIDEIVRTVNKHCNDVNIGFYYEYVINYDIHDFKFKNDSNMKYIYSLTDNDFKDRPYFIIATDIINSVDEIIGKQNENVIRFIDEMQILCDDEKIEFSYVDDLKKGFYKFKFSKNDVCMPFFMSHTEMDCLQYDLLIKEAIKRLYALYDIIHDR
jgi:hypothetical protein